MEKEALNVVVNASPQERWPIIAAAVAPICFAFGLQKQLSVFIPPMQAAMAVAVAVAAFLLTTAIQDRVMAGPEKKRTIKSIKEAHGRLPPEAIFFLAACVNSRRQTLWADLRESPAAILFQQGFFGYGEFSGKRVEVAIVHLVTFPSMIWDCIVEIYAASEDDLLKGATAEQVANYRHIVRQWEQIIERWQ